MADQGWTFEQWWNWEMSWLSREANYNTSEADKRGSGVARGGNEGAVHPEATATEALCHYKAHNPRNAAGRLALTLDHLSHPRTATTAGIRGKKISS